MCVPRACRNFSCTDRICPGFNFLKAWLIRFKKICCKLIRHCSLVNIPTAASKHALDFPGSLSKVSSSSIGG